MSIKSYHCNLCGAWLLVGEKHSCKAEYLDMVERITNFLSQSHHHPEETDHENLAEKLKEKAFPNSSTNKNST